MPVVQRACTVLQLSSPKYAKFAPKHHHVAGYWSLSESNRYGTTFRALASLFSILATLLSSDLIITSASSAIAAAPSSVGNSVALTLDRPARPFLQLTRFSAPDRTRVGQPWLHPHSHKELHVFGVACTT